MCVESMWQCIEGALMPRQRSHRCHQGTHTIAATTLANVVHAYAGAVTFYRYSPIHHETMPYRHMQRDEA